MKPVQPWQPVAAEVVTPVLEDPVIELEIEEPMPLKAEFPATKIAAIPAIAMTTITTPSANDLAMPFCKLHEDVAI